MATRQVSELEGIVISTRSGRAATATVARRLPPLSTALVEVLDEFAIRRLAQRGVPEPSRCLVTGAGTGSVASWLASQLGIDGEVVVTGTDPCRVPAYPGVTALRHDLATEPLAADSFQLIYARLPLAALPESREQVGRLVTALAPGGTIVLDETGPDGSLRETTDPAAGQLFARCRRALEAALRYPGSCGGRTPTWQVLAESGLTDVDTECWARSGHGEPDCLAVSTAGTKPLAAGRAPGPAPGQPESRSSSRWNSHTPAAWRPGRPPSG